MAKIQTWKRTWVQTVVAAFLCLSAAMILAAFGGRSVPAQVATQAAAAAASEWVPPMHEANSGTDVGPGCNEAALVGSPTSD